MRHLKNCLISEKANFIGELKMSPRARERFNYSFSPSFHKAIQDIAYNGLASVYGEDDKLSASAFLEFYVIRALIYPDLKKRNVNKPKLNAMLNSPERMCQFWLARREVERKTPGYKIHDNPKVGIIGVEIPHPDDLEKRIML